jgi:hypothetical protein
MKQPNRVKAAMRAGRRAYGYNAADHHTAIGMGDENDIGQIRDRGTGAGKISGNVFGEPRTRRHSVQDNK